MDKAIFEKHLIEATQRVLDFTPRFVTNKLPSECLYFIYPNRSFDEGYGPIGEDEERFPEDSKFDIIGPVKSEAVLEFLWRNGKVPQWVDVIPHSVDDSYIYIKLICCGRFMGDSRGLYHERRGTPPFQALGPALPSGWIDKTQEKFDLNKYKDA